jgi:hypothetical protein
MMQTDLTKKTISQTGEEISHELGAQMIKDYQTSNPNDVKGYRLGRNIIDEILAQPGCVGMHFCNAYNEKGEKTLVYTGVDEFGKSILEYTMVNTDGSFDVTRAIVGDRIPPDDQEEWWEEVIKNLK